MTGYDESSFSVEYVSVELEMTSSLLRAQQLA